MISARAVWKIDPVQSLQHLASGIKNKAMRIAINAGAAPMKAAVIAHAPSDTGNLKKAIKIKIKKYQNTYVAVIGASSKFTRMKKLKNGKRVKVRPAKYQPLVNRGTKHVRGQHFMEAALRSAQGQFAATVMRKLHEIITQLISQQRH